MNEKGAVSIFIVIFSALLIIIITTSFVRIMLQGQQQSTASDLSKSALDSAYAGIEDAKRAIALYNKCSAGGTCSPTWIPSNVLNGTDCNAVKVVIEKESTERLIDNSNGGGTQVGTDSSLNQAYTCATIHMQTDDYVGTLSKGSSQVIPLKGVADFDSIKIQWFSKADIDRNVNVVERIALESPARPPATSQLYQYGDWSQYMPSLIRAQILQLGSAFTVDGFNFENVGSTKNTATIFMRPVDTGTTTAYFNGDALQEVKCGVDGFDDTSRTPEYGCDITIQLSAPVARGTDAYLRLLAPYHDKTDYSVRLLKGGSDVKFDGVQPKVDVTGRASDLFRRVSTRVMPVNNFPFVDAALDLSEDLCKDFRVGPQSRDFGTASRGCDSSYYGL